MLKLLQFLLCITLVSSSCGPEQTKTNEGKKNCCYYDSKNIPTIGIGFNLQRTDASTVMATYKLTLSNVLKDCQKKTNKSCLTDSQVDDIFNRISYPEAATCVDKYVPNLPTIKRAAIIDVAFAGCATLNKFVKMKAALEKQDWQQAGNELRTSAWCTQVKQQRCNADYNCIIDGRFEFFSIFSKTLLVFVFFVESCTGAVCGSFVPGCLSNKNCYCYTMVNGTGFCAPNAFCTNLSDCTSCPSSTSVCLINTCCGHPVCMPLSLGTTCKSTPISRIANLIDQTIFKQSNERTTIKL